MTILYWTERKLVVKFVKLTKKSDNLNKSLFEGLKNEIVKDFYSELSVKIVIRNYLERYETKKSKNNSFNFFIVQKIINTRFLEINRRRNLKNLSKNFLAIKKLQKLSFQ